MADPAGEAQVSGAMVLGLRAALEQLVGAERVRAAVQSLDDQRRAEIEAATPFAWARISSIETLFGAVARSTGRDVVELHVAAAELALARTLKTLWRLFLRFTSDEALLARTPEMFAKAYDRGRLVPGVPRPGRGEIAVLGWPAMPEWPIRGVRVGIATVLRLAGRRDVEVSAEPAPDGARYVATWRA